jgi:hypothetical protein
MPSNIDVGSIADFSQLIEQQFRDDKTTTVIYRGHGAASFRLLPRVGRLKPNANTLGTSISEKLMLELFRRQAADRLETAVVDDWELLAIAQHHGMPTRLLDWTRSPLVALYFSVCKEYESRDREGRPLEEDAEVLVWRTEKVKLDELPPECGPFKIKKDMRYVPRIVTLRLRAQSGVFSVHHKPTSEFVPSDGLTRVRIPNKRRRDLKRSLYRHGIHEAVLFPDVGGLARHIEWLQTDCH